MNLNNLVEYIKSGANMVLQPRKSKILVLGSGILTFLGIVCGIVLGEYWTYVSIFMFISFLAATITVFVVSSIKPSIKALLINQLIICLSWILQALSLQTIIFTMAYGWCIEIVLLYAPVILTPVIFGFVHNMKLNKERSFFASKVVPWGIGAVGAAFGYMTITLARNFTDVSQELAVLTVLICFTLFSTILSIGLLNIQRLYYLCKYKKLGILTEDLFTLKPF